MNIVIQYVHLGVALVTLVVMARLLRAQYAMATAIDVSFDDVYRSLCDIGDTVDAQHCECCTWNDEYPVDTTDLVEDYRAPGYWLDYDETSDAVRLERAAKLLRERLAEHAAKVRRELELVEIARRELWDCYVARGY